ncbi:MULTISPECIES: hypothetical protein [unclassified Streptomyces]|uniref:hypothetical protein n=1 Tax=unclassified Streptomyces TaxID=2593676 RepID=UPI002E13E21A|nr:hypothetical protein OG452_34200 [Streptomyces sp. NBC_01197]WSS47281.1 hypothetical protein OG708_00625 [Streptomyces sp. NBC_01180]
MPRARPEAVQAPADVELIKGKPANIDDLRMAPEGTDAAISVLNNARASDNPWGRPITTAESTRPSTPPAPSSSPPAADATSASPGPGPGPT